MIKKCSPILLVAILLAPTVLPAFTVSGYIRTSGGAGISGVSVRLSGSVTYKGVTQQITETVTTSSTGRYIYSSTPPPPYLSGDGVSGTITPTLSGYTFSPTSSSFPKTALDGSVQKDFTGSGGTKTHLISGYVRTSGGTAISGVTMTFSNGGGSTTTNSSGYYSRSVNTGWSGTVTPSRSCYSFSPANRSFSSVFSNQVNQDFTGTQLYHTISGYVRGTVTGQGLDKVVLTFSNSGGTDTTNANGYFSKSVVCGWSGTATPSKVIWYGLGLDQKQFDLVFSPANLSYSNLSASKSNQNFTLPIRTVSGYVRLDSTTMLSDVTIHISDIGSTFTDINGYYIDTVDYGWSGSIVPKKDEYTFTVQGIPIIVPVSEDLTNLNFTATVPVTYTISAQAGPGGTIYPDELVFVLPGMDKTFTITPDSGYEILNVVVDGQAEGPVSSYTFKAVASNHSITAHFHIITTGIGTGPPGKPARPVVYSVRAGQTNTNITFSLEYEQTVSFYLTDIKGRIQVKWQQDLTAGEHMVPIKGSYPAGIYFFKVQGTGVERIFKLVTIQ